MFELYLILMSLTTLLLYSLPISNYQDKYLFFLYKSSFSTYKLLNNNIIYQYINNYLCIFSL